jgi:hypothetical protein
MLASVPERASILMFLAKKLPEEECLLLLVCSVGEVFTAFVARGPRIELSFKQPWACLGGNERVVDCWFEETRFAFEGKDVGTVGVVDAAPVGEAESIAPFDV